MIGQARVVGVLVLLGGLVVSLASIGWLAGAKADGSVQAGGFMLGLLLVIAVCLPVMAAGIYLIVKGRSEVADYAQAEQTKKLLNMVLTQGKVRISDAVVELGVPRETVRDMIYDAVGRGLFSGYINWKEGVLYASEAAQGQQSCPNCGGTIELAGKGVFQCPYCGTELFLARGEAGRHEINGVEPPADWPGSATVAEPSAPAVTPSETAHG